MKVLGLIDFDYKDRTLWNGEAIRTLRAGGSGTEQSFVLLCEFLAAEGHDISLSFCRILEDTVINNVKYISFNKVRETSDNYDILLNTSSHYEFMSLSLSNLKKLVIWCHYQGYIAEHVCRIFKIKYPNCKIYTNRMAKFVMKYLDKFHPYYEEFSDYNFEIDNPIMLDMFQNNIQKDKNSFIFFASFERGGQIAMDAYKRLNLENKKFYFTSPDTFELERNDITSDIIPIRWSDKCSTFKLLSQTEYFIYPLVLPLSKGSIIHKDTDGCVVAESLLHEVIVLTYPVGALKEKYGEHLVYLPYPQGVNQDILEGPDQVSVPQFHSEFVIDSIIKTIEFLENNPSFKEVLKKKGKEFILKQRNIDVIGQQWLENLHLV